MDKRMPNSGYGVIPTQHTNSYELASKYNITDKRTGNYSRYSVTEKLTKNQRHVERGARREGVRDEYKTTEKIKVGNENGYTEYQSEETFRIVTHDNNTSGTKNNVGSTKYSTEGRSSGGVYGDGVGIVVYNGGGSDSNSYGFDSDSGDGYDDDVSDSVENDGNVDIDVDGDGDGDYYGECDCDYDWDDYEDVDYGGVDYDDEY